MVDSSGPIGYDQDPTFFEVDPIGQHAGIRIKGLTKVR